MKLADGLTPAERSEVEEARRMVLKFRRGMTRLGRGCIYLAIAGCGVLLIGLGTGTMAVAAWVFVALGMHAVIAAAGVLVLLRKVWATHALIVIFGVAWIATIAYIMMTGEGLAFVGLIVPTAAILQARANLRSLSMLQAAGIDPVSKTVREEER